MFSMFRKMICLVSFVLVLVAVPLVTHAQVENISNYEGGHQIWFEAEDYDERNPDTDQYFPVVDAAGAFGQAITRAGDSGGMIRWTFDISKAGGKGGTWYFWARLINPSNQSDYMLVEGDPDDAQIPTGPPFPGDDETPPFVNDDDRVFEIDVGPPWGWAQSWGIEGHTKELQNGENTMYIFHRDGDNTVFWDVFMWTDSPDYVPTDEDYENAMIFVPGKAAGPSPANEATDVPREVVLSWTPGEFAAPTNGHKVYFGESFDDVNDATGGVAQTAPGYTPPQRLDFGTTYYWRVDEVNAPPASHIEFKGRVWSFTVEPIAYSLAGEYITAIASSLNTEGEGPSNIINDSGLNSDDLHSTETVDMWLSSDTAEPPAWIQYEFDKVYKLHEMWVWNHNTAVESLIGFGFKDVTIEYSVNSTDYTTLGNTHEFARASGAADYAHNTTVDFSGVPAKYVRLTANSNWGGILDQYGLSEVRFFYIPVRVREPSPDSGATDVELEPTLGFRAGREAAMHDVYFSSDEQAVIDGNTPVTTVTETSYGPLSLDLGKTYYWRVDEVNETEILTIWQGDIWNFTTQEYFVVDDFEDYDAGENQIWYAWKDGLGYGTPGTEPYFAGNGTGSAVGDETTGSYTEETIVHSGSQSMPIFYDNNKQGSLKYSEAEMTLSYPRDWTEKGISTLTIWFRGNPAGFVEEPAGTFTISASGADIWDTADEFRYAFKQLSGAGWIVAKVESVENTDAWTKAGVMIRETLDPDSKFAAVYITPGNGCRFQGRLTTGASATSDTSVATAEQMAIQAPYWVKLERDASGNFNGYYSSDGVSWQAMTWNPQRISMSPNVYIGLALTSHSAGVNCEAEFSNVQTTGTVSPPMWTQEAIGIVMASNDPEPMYVALNGSAVVSHDNPDAAQIAEWTEWTIDLQAFADQGVNLANVNTIALGLGDKKNPLAGGSGTMYFDDIRLYPPPPAQ